jgi:hypothetical protein
MPKSGLYDARLLGHRLRVRWPGTAAAWTSKTRVNYWAMSTAEHIYDAVRTLPESQAREVLDFVTHLKAKRHADHEARRQGALSVLTKYRGRFEAVKTQRDELYDRKGLR